MQSLQVDRVEAGAPLRLWYAVAAAPTAWVLQGGIDWLVTGRACADQDPAWGPLSGSGVRVLLVLTGVAAIAAGSAALVFAFRAWRQTSGRTSLTEAYGYGVVEYLAIAGVIVSGVFLLAMVWALLPAVVVDVCEGAR